MHRPTVWEGERRAERERETEMAEQFPPVCGTVPKVVSYSSGPTPSSFVSVLFVEHKKSAVRKREAGDERFRHRGRKRLDLPDGF